MPWISPLNVIYLAGCCLGPHRYGVEDAQLFDRVWQGYLDVTGTLRLRKSNVAMTDWEWEDIPDGLEGIDIAYPDLAFDKAGQPVITFQRRGVAGPEVWVRRVTVVAGLREVIVEKVSDGMRPRVIRDFGNDILVFYEVPLPDGSTDIRWRVQSEGWATERTVPLVAGRKYLLGVTRTRDMRLSVVFAFDGDINGGVYHTDTVQYYTYGTTPPPLPVWTRLGAGARCSDLGFVPAIGYSSSEACGVGALVYALDIAPALLSPLPDRAGVMATAQLTIITTVQRNISDKCGVQATVTLSLVPVLNEFISNTCGGQALVADLQLPAA